MFTFSMLCPVERIFFYLAISFVLLCTKTMRNVQLLEFTCLLIAQNSYVKFTFEYLLRVVLKICYVMYLLKAYIIAVNEKMARSNSKM